MSRIVELNHIVMDSFRSFLKDPLDSSIRGEISEGVVTPWIWFKTPNISTKFPLITISVNTPSIEALGLGEATIQHKKEYTQYFSGDGSTNRFTLSTEPEKVTAVYYPIETLQPTNEYTVNGSDIEFVDIVPADGTNNICVKFFSATIDDLWYNYRIVLPFTGTFYCNKDFVFTINGQKYSERKLIEYFEGYILLQWRNIKEKIIENSEMLDVYDFKITDTAFDKKKGIYSFSFEFFVDGFFTYKQSDIADVYRILEIDLRVDNNYNENYVIT